MTVRRRLLNARELMVSVAILSFAISTAAQPTGSKRPMTFTDILNMRSAAGAAVSPDGKWMLYTLSVPDWKAAKSFTDVYLVSVDSGVASTRQMTFTKDKNETLPRWSRDGKLFVFASNREAPTAAPTQNQLYMMRPDGGESREITDAKDGVSAFAFSRDGKWLAFSAGKEGEQQIWIISIDKIESEAPTQLTKHATPVSSWQFAPDSKRIYFLAPESFDKANKERKEKKFDVRIRNEEPPLTHLWAFDLDAKKEERLTSGEGYSVGAITISRDSKWIGFEGQSNKRYLRTVTESADYSDLYLMEVGTGKIERLTNNKDIREGPLSFSPDGLMIAYSATDDFTYFRNRKVYVRRVTGGDWKKLGTGFDFDLSTGFWSTDGKTIYFNAGIRATSQLCSVSTETGQVTQLTRENGVVLASQDDDSRVLTLTFSDPMTPGSLYTVASLDQIANRSAWRRLTDANPQIPEVALGATELVQWKSSDGRMVEGILVKPVGYERGKRYPLIVQIHGGPAGADLLNFNATYVYYSHLYAGAGYACLLPNYRGSSNYGEKHRMEIGGEVGGEYFRLGYDDIMTGVDYLIAQGIADGDKMGAMGWSAGGHWSNWILTHTNRFKAISSGAGAVNWISMYAQSDIQRNREFYYGGLPYDRFEEYWNVSPLKYIKNAKTPTLIHVVDGDPRVPRPQSEELHMALKKLGVPTEFLVYPGATHGITEPRNQLVKMVSEFNWFEKWIRGKQGWFEWKDLVETVKDDKAEEKKKEVPDSAKEPD